MPAISTPPVRAFSSGFALVLCAACATQTLEDPLENGLGVETGGSAGDAGNGGSAGSAGDQALGGSGGAGTSAGSGGVGGGGPPQIRFNQVCQPTSMASAIPRAGPPPESGRRAHAALASV